MPSGDVAVGIKELTMPGIKVVITECTMAECRMAEEPSMRGTQATIRAAWDMVLGTKYVGLFTMTLRTWTTMVRACNGMACTIMSCRGTTTCIARDIGTIS
jgi:hypothetical protein